MAKTCTYNKRAYHYDESGKKVEDQTKLYGQDKDGTFEQWYLRTLIQYQTTDSSFDLRFVSVPDENLDEYQKAGFDFTVDGVLVADDYFFFNGYSIDINDAELYFANRRSLTVTAYVVLADGSKLSGKTVAFTLVPFGC